LLPMGWGIAALVAIAHSVAGWPLATIPVAQSPAWSLAFVAAGLTLCGLLRGPVRLTGLPLVAIGLAAPHFTRPPDILVGPDAALIAVRIDASHIVAATTQISAYETEAPARLWGMRGPPTRLPCQNPACRLTLRKDIVVILRDGADIDCTAAIILSSGSLHASCPGTPIIDHAFIRREGATTLRLGVPGPVIVTDRSARGSRPWVLHQTATLPMAATE
jgi:competence protein ComEC